MKRDKRGLSVAEGLEHEERITPGPSAYENTNDIMRTQCMRFNG